MDTALGIQHILLPQGGQQKVVTWPGPDPRRTHSMLPNPITVLPLGTRPGEASPCLDPVTCPSVSSPNEAAT